MTWLIQKITPIIKTLLWRERMQFTEFLNEAEQELYENVKGLFETLSDRLKSQQQRQYCLYNICKPLRNTDKSTEELMQILRVKVMEWKYKERSKILKEQFTCGLNDQSMIAELIRELTVIRDEGKVKSQKVSPQQTKIMQLGVCGKT